MHIQHYRVLDSSLSLPNTQRHCENSVHLFKKGLHFIYDKHPPPCFASHHQPASDRRPGSYVISSPAERLQHQLQKPIQGGLGTLIAGAHLELATHHNPHKPIQGLAYFSSSFYPHFFSGFSFMSKKRTHSR